MNNVNKIYFTDSKEYENSSTILKIDYDSLKQTLLIYFKNGNIYEYCGISIEFWNELKLFSGSIGKFFHEKIKLNYDFLKK